MKRSGSETQEVIVQKKSTTPTPMTTRTQKSSKVFSENQAKLQAQLNHFAHSFKTDMPSLTITLIGSKDEPDSSLGQQAQGQPVSAKVNLGEGTNQRSYKVKYDPAASRLSSVTLGDLCKPGYDPVKLDEEVKHLVALLVGKKPDGTDCEERTLVLGDGSLDFPDPLIRSLTQAFSEYGPGLKLEVIPKKEPVQQKGKRPGALHKHAPTPEPPKRKGRFGFHTFKTYTQAMSRARNSNMGVNPLLQHRDQGWDN